MHVSWPNCAWRLLSFFPFPVGHPMSASCTGMLKIGSVSTAPRCWHDCICQSRSKGKKGMETSCGLCIQADESLQDERSRRPSPSRGEERAESLRACLPACSLPASLLARRGRLATACPVLRSRRLYVLSLHLTLIQERGFSLSLSLPLSLPHALLSRLYA